MDSRWTAAVAAAGWLALAAAVQAAPATQNDVVLGNGSSGPYALSWRNLAANTESVSSSGSPLVRGIDYTVDAAAGTITFVRPLSQKEPVLVRYEYDTADAQRGASPLASPLTLDLAETSSSRVFALAQYHPTGTAASAAANGALTLGLGTSWQGSGRSSADARLYVAPDRADGADRSPGLVFHGAAGAGRNGLVSFGYSRAPKSLDSRSDPALQAGKQQMDAQYSLTPSRMLQTTLTFHQTEAIDGGAPSSTTAANFVLNPNPTLKIAGGVSLADTAGQATATTSTFSVTAKPIDTTGGRPTGTSLLVTATGRSVDGPQDQTQTAVGLSLSRATTVGAASGPILRLNANYTDRSASGAIPSSQALDTAEAIISLQSGNALALSGHVVQNPTDGGRPLSLRRRGVALKTAFGRVTFNGGIDWLLPAGAGSESAETNVGIAVRLGVFGDLTSSYRQSPRVPGAQAPGQTSYAIGYRRSVSSVMNIALDGSYTIPTAAAANYKTTATIGLRW